MWNDRERNWSFRSVARCLGKVSIAYFVLAQACHFNGPFWIFSRRGLYNARHISHRGLLASGPELACVAHRACMHLRGALWPFRHSPGGPRSCAPHPHPHSRHPIRSARPRHLPARTPMGMPRIACCACIRSGSARAPARAPGRIEVRKSPGQAAVRREANRHACGRGPPPGGALGLCVRGQGTRGDAPLPGRSGGDPGGIMTGIWQLISRGCSNCIKY